MTDGIKEMLKKFIDEYASELTSARTSEDYKRPFGNFVRRDIASLFQAHVDASIYKVKGSVGAGRWTDVPWIAVFDKRITTSAQRGVYIVYLLNKDTKELFLTLNQGATDVTQGGGGGADRKLSFTGIASTNNKKTSSMLIANAEHIRREIEDDCSLPHGNINTGSSAYDAGCIYYKKYKLENVPDENELYEDLDEFIAAYKLYYDKVFNIKVPEKKEGGTELDTKQILEKVKNYISAKGFLYDSNLIENFYLCLKTKPFVLLAGTSGTGKTRLVRLFAEAIGAIEDGRYLQVAVKPDWSDSTDLFGHLNLDNKFVPGAIIEFIKEASEDGAGLPYILCLDEMNLARVEYYMSDFLSVIETRDWSEQTIKTDKLVPKACYSGNNDASTQYGDLRFPENLYLIGTVNMDETTFPFSKKVLDRANTIEFSFVDFELPESLEEQNETSLLIKNEFLKSNYLRLMTDCADKWESVKKINDKLTSINLILKEGDAHFGYRMRDEMIFYMLYNEDYGLIDEDSAFDNQILQKVLPRIQGSSESITRILKRLFSEVCAGPFETQNGMSDSYKMENYIKDSNLSKYPRSAEKIWKMLRRFEEDDFTSFWA